jgi:hypothetical protein
MGLGLAEMTVAAAVWFNAREFGYDHWVVRVRRLFVAAVLFAPDGGRGGAAGPPARGAA